MLHSSVCLASPFRDPEGRFLDLIKENGKKLLQLYQGNAVVSVSPTTSPSVIYLLNSLQFTTKIQRKNSEVLIGNNYLNAIKLAINTKTRYIHLVDFDRALHWIKRFPRELRDVLDIFPSCQGYTSFIRTKRAFKTHPQTQRSTENIINIIASEAAGVEVDIMSGSYGFERKLAQKIVQEARRKDFGIYAEFLRIAIKHHFLISTIEAEGLEWETPDQYQDEIRRESYSAWLKHFQSLSEWQKRITLLEESAEVLIPKKREIPTLIGMVQ